MTNDMYAKRSLKVIDAESDVSDGTPLTDMMCAVPLSSAMSFSGLMFNISRTEVRNTRDKCTSNCQQLAFALSRRKCREYSGI